MFGIRRTVCHFMLAKELVTDIRKSENLKEASGS